MKPFIAFTVPGKPAPQGSKRHVGRGIMVEASKDLGPWRERVALAAHQHMNGGALLTDAPVRVKVEFVMPRPTSTPKTKPTPPAIKKNSDIDKLSRAILDALTGVVFTDDCLVTELRASKRIAERAEGPGAIISVEEL